MAANPMDVWKTLGHNIDVEFEKLSHISGSNYFEESGRPPAVLDLDTIGTAERLAFLCKMRDELRAMFLANTNWTKA